MTQNQIAYQNLIETQRKNLASEGLTGSQIAESVRSNKAKEAIQADTLAETTRANKAKEKQAKNELAETARSNKRNENIKIAQTATKTTTDAAGTVAKFIDALIPG